MIETAPPAPSSPAPQTSNIFVDRPCLKCGYNLRGQTATWNRRALNWQVTCPECGGAQVVVLGSAERGGGHSIVTLLLALIGVWIVGAMAVIVTGTIVQGIPIALFAILLGALISIAPYARAQDRRFVLALLVLGCVVYGIYLDFSGQLPDRSSIGLDAKWKLLSGSIGVVLAYGFGRIGLAAGRPFAKMVTGMYVKTDN